MAKTRKTRSSAPTTEPTLPESEPTPEPEQTPQPTLSEPEQSQETEETIVSEPEENQTEEPEPEETIQTEEPIVSEPEQTQEEVIVTEPEQNPETNQNESVIQENEKVEKIEELEEESVESLIEPFTKDQLTLLIKEAVSKHPDIIKNVNKIADFDPSHRKIFVHGLGYDSTIETVTPVFQEYGEIEDCKLVKDKITGKSKGYAFILFKKRNAARLALRQPQKLIGGRMTSSQLASAGPVGVGNQLSEQNVSELSLRKIFVSNVGAETDTNRLTEFFGKFGEIEDGPLGLDKVTGKPRGFCLFVYKNVESAKKALVEPHKSFEGQMLHCQQAVDGPRNGFGKGGASSSSFAGNVAKRGRYNYNGGGGHMMAPSARPVFNNSHGVAPEAIGQAFAALLAQSGSGYGNMMNNVGYGGQGGGYGGQPGYQGGYGGQQQTGQGGVWPYQGGAPYMGHGR